jgi:hypothetical protein
MKEERENLLANGDFSLEDSLPSSTISPTLANIKLISRSASTATLNSLSGGGLGGQYVSRDANSASNGNNALNSNNKSSAGNSKKKDNDPLSHDFTKFFNMRNAKFIALFFVIIFVLYHGSLNSFYGEFRLF